MAKGKKALTPKKEKLGLGDAIDKVTTKTGIKKLVHFVAGEDCGCTERMQKLNKIKLPINTTAKRCFSEEQYKAFGEYRERRTLKRWEEKDVILLIELYAHVFALQYNKESFCSNCDGSAKLLIKIDNHLEEVYLSYNK